MSIQMRARVLLVVPMILWGCGHETSSAPLAPRDVTAAALSDDIETESAVASDYVMTELAGFGGVQTVAVAINDRGDIVGHGLLPGGSRGDWHAFVIKGGVMSALPTLGGATSSVSDIDPTGRILGWVSGPPGKSGNVLWDGGTITRLQSLYPEMFLVRAINANGQILGSCPNSHLWEEPCLFDHGRTIHLQPKGDSFASRAYALNASGVVVGVRQSAKLSRAVEWNGSNAIALPALTTPGWAAALGINDAGDVVGGSVHAVMKARIGRATLWRNSVPIDIGATAGLPSSASAINNRGVIVGSATDAHGNSRGFVWRNGRRLFLPTNGLSVLQVSPVDINIHGEIVGNLYLSVAESRAVVWRKR